LLDLLKGTAAVLIAAHFAPGYPMILAALGAFLGHLFPAWLKFKGGKGVATFLGCLLGTAWQAALVFVIVWLAVAFLTRYSSAAALSASALTPIVLAIMGESGPALMFGFMTILLWTKHRANIARLAAGTESRIGTA
jgi:acyl phosphate:glycerol-3-phosphate acyltransferase